MIEKVGDYVVWMGKTWTNALPDYYTPQVFGVTRGTKAEKAVTKHVDKNRKTFAELLNEKIEQACNDEDSGKI